VATTFRNTGVKQHHLGEMNMFRQYLVLLLFVFALFSITRAQDDLTFEGTIDAANPTVEYTIELDALQPIVISLDADNSDLDPVLTLLDSTGVVVAENDDIDTDGGDYNSQVAYTPDVAGTFTIRASSFGDSSGDFILTVTFGEPNPLPESLEGTTTVFEGTIGEGDSGTNYPIDLAAGDAILVQTQALSGDLDTIVALFDPSGVELATNDDANRGAGNFNSALYYEAQGQGTYTVNVSNYGGTGDYALTVTVQSARATGDTLITLDEIDDTNETVTYDIDLETGTSLIVQTQSVTGSLDTILTLIDPEGNQVVENDDVNTDGGNYNSTIVYEVEQSGTYTLNVGRYSSTIGSYLLTATISADATIDLITASSQTFTEQGSVTESAPQFSYPVTLDAGQTVLLQTEAITESLDTVMTLLAPNGETVAENDDYQSESYNSGLVFTVHVGGTYTALVEGYGDSTGDFTLNITLGGEELVAQLDNIKRVQLSGPELTRETEHFVIHYTTEGDDAATDEYVQAATEIVELVWNAEINELGWAAPPPDNEAGGDNRFDLYLVNIFNEEADCLYGYASPEQEAGDNPNTPEIETFASTSYMVVDNDYDRQNPAGGTCGGEGTATGDLLTTMAHEFNHAIQFGYDAAEPHHWMFEAIATWLETQVAGDSEQATPYVSSNFEVPEVCFGSKDSTLVYGNWMFIQSLVDAYGPEVVEELWRNAVTYDGFEALDTTVAAFGDDVPTAMSRYFIQNLLRDYALAARFGSSVWRENVINGIDTWGFTGNGVQELASNYFDIQLRPGVYSATLTGSEGNEMQLWGIGIRGNEADSVALGQSGTFSNEGYDFYYLMIFNPTFDEDLDECTFYTDYAIQIGNGSGTPAPIERTWNASHFEPIG
jgi:hypothetical protein